MASWHPSQVLLKSISTTRSYRHPPHWETESKKHCAWHLGSAQQGWVPSLPSSPVHGTGNPEPWLWYSKMLEGKWPLQAVTTWRHLFFFDDSNTSRHPSNGDLLSIVDFSTGERINWSAHRSVLFLIHPYISLTDTGLSVNICWMSE